MRVATARAASRRGSSITMFRPVSQGASSSASGTPVLLHAPGGASITALHCCASVVAIPGSSGAIGSERKMPGSVMAAAR